MASKSTNQYQVRREELAENIGRLKQAKEQAKQKKKEERLAKEERAREYKLIRDSEELLRNTTRTCQVCGETYPTTREYWVSHGKTIKSKRCRKCFNKAKQIRRKYSDKQIKSIKEWNENNREKWSVYTKRYASLHSDRVRTNSKLQKQKRRSLQRGMKCDLTKSDWKRALEYFHDCCAVCGRPQGLWHTLAQDHWIPLSSPDCPGTTAKNIVPLCHGIDGCNNKKNSKNPETWLVETYGIRKAKSILQRIESYFNSL